MEELDKKLPETLLEIKIQEALAAGDIDEVDAREIRRIHEAANQEIGQYLPNY